MVRRGSTVRVRQRAFAKLPANTPGRGVSGAVTKKVPAVWGQVLGTDRSAGQDFLVPSGRGRKVRSLLGATPDMTLSLDALVRSVALRSSEPHSLFLGAGASITSGVKSAENCIWEWKRQIFITQ